MTAPAPVFQAAARYHECVGREILASVLILEWDQAGCCEGTVSAPHARFDPPLRCTVLPDASLGEVFGEARGDCVVEPYWPVRVDPAAGLPEGARAWVHGVRWTAEGAEPPFGWVPA